MHRQTLRVFSNVAPIQPGVMTMVDLGDTSHCLTVALPQQSGGDGSSGLTANTSRLSPIFNLRKMLKPREQGKDDLEVELRPKGELGGKEVPKLPQSRLQKAKTLSPDGEGVSVSVAATPPPTVACSGTGFQSPVRGDEGLKLPRQSLTIRRTGLATRWYIVLGSGAIEKPPVLHTTTDLEIGDLFVNKYYSKSYNKDVLQVWLLLPTSDGEGFWWSQASGETEHPNLPGFVLSFQPADLSAPSWVQRKTDQRRRRERPRILVSGEGTFTE